MGPKPMELLSVGPHLRKFQPKDISLYDSLGIEFYEAFLYKGLDIV